jgi:hypothetical protein
MSKNEKKVTIDNKDYVSHDPTTGVALYVLGGVNVAEYDLWLEVPGPKDDELVPNDDTTVDLKGNNKFYTAQKDLNPGQNA